LPDNSRCRILPGQPEALALSTRPFRLITRILSLALLLGQMGATAHAYSHAADDPQGLPETTQGCRTCHSFAPLLSAVGGSQSVLLVAPCAGDDFVSTSSTLVPDSPHHPAFRSRAPPVLL
jgi:hypothetical protein